MLSLLIWFSQVRKRLTLEVNLTKAKATNPEVLVISALMDETVRGLVQSYEVGIPKSVYRVTASIGSKVEIPTNAGSAAKGVTYAAAFAASDKRPID